MTMRSEPSSSRNVHSGPAALGELRGLSTTDGGTALSTTKARILIPEGTAHLFITPRNFSTAVVAQISLLPYLSVFKTEDDGATFDDYSSEAQDNDAATDVTLSSLDAAADGGYLYVGAHRKFAGLTVDVDAANGTASVMTVKYWDGVQWTDISDTDNTASGGATFAVDGDITWAIPTVWQKSSVNRRKLYWVRIEVSVALDSSTTLNSLWPMPAFTTAELVSGQTLELSVLPGAYGFRAVQAETDAGTANLVIIGASGIEEF